MPFGTLKSITDQFGNVTQVTAHNANNQIQEIQSTSTVGSSTITESYYYTYTTVGTASVLQNVTLRRKTNGGAWTNIRQVAYTYYGTGSSYGNQGDLQTATIEDGSGTALDTYYYRYYTTTGSGGVADYIQYVFDPRSYGRLAAAFANPLTATNAQVAPYAEMALQYNTNKQVS